MNTITAVLFDFNGVVIDDEPVHRDAWREVLAPCDLTFTDEEYYGPLLGIPDDSFLDRLVAMRGKYMDEDSFLHRLLTMRGKPMDDDKRKQLIADKGQLYNQLVRRRDVINPGLVEFVHDLAAHVPLGVVSGALRPEIEYHLDVLNLTDCFRIVVAAGEYPQSKPDPAPYLVGLQKLAQAVETSLDPSSVIVVEDSAHGMASGLAAGMPVFGFCGRIAPDKLPGCFATITDFTKANFDWLQKSLSQHREVNS